MKRRTAALHCGRPARRGQTLKQIAGLPENPRIAETPATNGHAVRSGFSQKTKGIGRFAHAAAAEDRDRHRPFDASHDAPVGPADISLGHAAGMDVHGSGPSVRRAVGDFDGGFVVRVGAAANFERHRDRHGAGHGGDNALDDFGPRQQRAALATLDEPADRALEVQVHHVEAVFLDDAGRLGHASGVSAAYLSGPRLFFGGRVQQPQRPPVPPRNVNGVNAFGASEAGAVLLHQQPKRVIRVFLHRRQGDRMRQAEAWERGHEFAACKDFAVVTVPAEILAEQPGTSLLPSKERG